MPKLVDSRHNPNVPRDTLIDFFRDLVGHPRGVPRLRRRLPAAAPFLRRCRARRARVRAKLSAAGLQKGDKVVFWGENRPEWIACYWGCLLAGVIVVPIDYRSSADFVAKVRRLVEARVVLVGDDVPMRDAGITDFGGAQWWRFADLDWQRRRPDAGGADRRATT